MCKWEISCRYFIFIAFTQRMMRNGDWSHKCCQLKAYMISISCQVLSLVFINRTPSVHEQPYKAIIDNKNLIMTNITKYFTLQLNNWHAPSLESWNYLVSRGSFYVR